jgi:uncharacterized protein (DUF2267 family)
MKPEAFYRTVMDAIGDEDRAGAVRATAAVLAALRDRLTMTEAAQVCAQLPKGLKEHWQAGDVPGRRPRRMHEPEFCRRVAQDAKLPAREGRRATLAVFGALEMQLSAGEADDVLAQLPRDLKLMWSVARAASARRPAGPRPRAGAHEYAGLACDD